LTWQKAYFVADRQTGRQQRDRQLFLVVGEWAYFGGVAANANQVGVISFTTTQREA